MTPEQTAEMITKDYRNHEAKYCTAELPTGAKLEYLTWGKPGTCVGFVSFIAIGNSLIVRGDYGEAIYMVTDVQPLRFWENTGISYFKEKCRASEGGYGSKWNDWSESECHRRIDEMVKEHWEDSEEGMPPTYEEYLDDWKNAACTRQDYEMFVMRNDHVFEKLLGDYWADYDIWSLGNIHPFRLHCHHIGLKLAVKQLRDKGVEI